MGADFELAALASRLSSVGHGLDLSSLMDCVTDTMIIDRDRVICGDGVASDRLYLLEDGFAFDYSLLAGGKRHIIDFYGPGAICNWTRPERRDRRESILFKARSRILVLSRQSFKALLDERADIASALREHEMRRALRISQRTRALISLPAKDCLRILLLDVDDELRLTAQGSDWLPLPLTQEEIGDLIGATSVHVSRTIAALERGGEVARSGMTFRLSDADLLRERMAYRRFTDPLP